MDVTKVSMLSGKENTMNLDVTQEQLDRYDEGIETVQIIFPKLSVEEREFLITGSTSEEWEKTFGKEEDWDTVLGE